MEIHTMSNVFEAKAKATLTAIRLDIFASVSDVDAFLDGTGYSLEVLGDADSYTNIIIENENLDIEIVAQLDDIIVKDFDNDISIYSQQAFDLRYDRVA